MGPVVTEKKVISPRATATLTQRYYQYYMEAKFTFKCQTSLMVFPIYVLASYKAVYNSSTLCAVHKTATPTAKYNLNFSF